MSAPRTARDRVREEMTGEILEVASRHLARDGGAALSLRSIARDLEMAPSALYRYFASRDALLTALVQGAYASLADQAEAASAAAYETEGGDAARWPAVPGAMRSWALARPHEWGLIFGAPVPGYVAPESTVDPYVRLTAALVRPLQDAQRGGRLQVAPATTAPPAEVAAALQPVTDGLLPGVPVEVVSVALQAWATLTGIINLELFGHWRNTVWDPELFFEETVARLGVTIGLRP
jgi:AcrR family transcriptional regulator